MRRETETRLAVQVKANSKQSEVRGFSDETLHIMVAAPATEGRANRELIAFLSRLLDVGKSQICIEKGAASRKKLVLIRGLDRDQILCRLGLT